MQHLQLNTRHPIRVLELFAGSRSFGKVCDQLGIPVFSCDLEAFPGIDHVGDFRRMRYKDLPWAPTLLIAGVPCTSYSICGIRYHRDGIVAKSDTARIGDELVQKTIRWAKHFGCSYMIENPVGMLRHMPFMSGLPRRSITYCSYGARAMKPTDLWSNMFRDLWTPDGWEPRPKCRNGNRQCHHDPQPRSYAKRKEMGVAHLGTTGMSNAFLRSIYPPALVHEVMAHALATITEETPITPPYITHPKP
jgi:hypothetical protein